MQKCTHFCTKLHSEQLPVQKIPHLSTKLHTEQIPVQKIPLLSTKLHSEQFPVQKRPHLSTKLHTEQIPVQKRPLLSTKLHTEQIPVQKIPLLSTKTPHGTDSGAENTSFEHKIKKGPAMVPFFQYPLSISRRISFSFMVLRLSYSRFPFAREMFSLA